MKKTMINLRTVAMALVTFLAIGFTQSTYAATPVTELKFVGNFNSTPVFQLVLNNTENAEYVVVVRDNDKKVLFSEKLNGTQISRRYKLQAEDLAQVAGTTFEITNKKTNETTKYEVNSSSSFITDVSIAKL